MDFKEDTKSSSKSTSSSVLKPQISETDTKSNQSKESSRSTSAHRSISCSRSPNKSQKSKPDKKKKSKRQTVKQTETIKTNSSSVNYNPEFKRHKQETEMEELNFETDTNENYNLPFTILELEFLAHLSTTCSRGAFRVTGCPLSVVRRPSCVINNSLNRWANLDQTWQECSLGGPL